MITGCVGTGNTRSQAAVVATVPALLVARSRYCALSSARATAGTRNTAFCAVGLAGQGTGTQLVLAGSLRSRCRVCAMLEVVAALNTASLPTTTCASAGPVACSGTAGSTVTTAALLVVLWPSASVTVTRSCMPSSPIVTGLMTTPRLRSVRKSRAAPALHW